jgi:hypothetical protein
MGDLVEGFGDEVVLFVAFLTLSLVFLTLLSYTRRHRTSGSGRGEPEQQDHAQHPEGPNQQQSQGELRTADGLRHRISATPSAEREVQRVLRNEQPRDSGHDGDQQPVSGVESAGRHDGDRGFGTGIGGGIGGGEARLQSDGSEQQPGRTTEGDINVRLIQPGGPGRAREVCVAPDVTLQYLRR